MAGQPTPNVSSRRLTRCRTGCMRCRIRRRKCDEGKPRCRNCIARNFQCQYGPQLTFLRKNAHTVAPTEVGSEATASYNAIRFINEGPSKEIQDPDQSGQTSTPAEVSSSAGAHASTVAVQPENQFPSNVVPELRGLEAPSQISGPVFTFWSPENTYSQTTATTRPGRYSAKDESAVAGLLALGTGMGDTDMMVSDFGLSDFVASPLTHEAPHAAAMTQSTFSGPRSSTFSPREVGNTTDSKSTEALELLRHYRYEVAPWLDLCDLGQSFGINVLQLAKELQPVWVSILCLSETSFSQLHPEQGILRALAADKQGNPDAHLDFTARALLNALDGAKNCIKSICNAWAHRREDDKELLDAICLRAVGRDLASAIYWLLARLDIGAALVNDTDIHIPLPPSLPYLVDIDPIVDPFGMVFHFAHRPLLLCARALQFIHNEESPPDCSPLQTWMQLVDELEHWYHERPQEFQPMLELEMHDQLAGPERSFPVVLFSNGAGAFGSQLYHTAMLVLLHNRPRTAPITDFNPTAMSPLWHAQRICSIALHNDRQECWDPCLLASFLMAARRMTHESQQQEILRAFERIRTMTGFDISERLLELRQIWCLLDET